jgi:uncharacterized membrane protein YfcA
VRAILASPLGFLVGLSLGALGGGGSILAVPALVYGAGQDPREATTTSLLLVMVASLVGLRAHVQAGRVRFGVGIAVGLAGIGGSLLGSAINRRLDPDVLLLGFAILIAVAAWRMLTACPTCTAVGEQRVLFGSGSASEGASTRTSPGVVLAVLALGTGIGFLTGLFGVGGGFVVVPALTLVLKLSMPEAIGTSLVVIAINSAVGLSARVATTDIDWAVTIPFVIAAVAGVVTGGAVADRLDARKSLRWFAALLITLSIYTAIDAMLAITA